MAFDIQKDYDAIVELGTDLARGRQRKYSATEASDALRQALIDANGGSTTLDIRAIRDGRSSLVFSIVEDILNTVVPEGLQSDDYFNALVDFRNVGRGDKNEFIVRDQIAFQVSEMADGTKSIRRQRFNGETRKAIATSVKGVRIYEELTRVLSGQTDWNTFVTAASESMRRRMLEDIYALWQGATDTDFGGNVYYPSTGSYDEETLLDIIAHVEAASGSVAKILCTRKMARKLLPNGKGDSFHDDIYQKGAPAYFYGTPVIVLPQRHKVGTTDFVFDDNTITVLAGDLKPIKCVYEGDSLVLAQNPLQNADLTQELWYMDKYGLELIVSGSGGACGRYVVS